MSFAEYAKLILAVDSTQARTAAGDLDRLAAAGGRAEKSFLTAERSFGGLRSALAALGAGVIAKGVIDTVDAYASLEGRLRLVTDGASNLADVQRELFDLSQKTLTAVQDTTALYISLSNATKDLGASQSDLLRFTEGVGNALRLSSATTQQASSAIMQLGQILAGANVEMADYRTLIDSAPELLRAVARNVEGAGGSIGKLTLLVREGKISSKDFFEAFLRDTGELEKRAGSLPRTIGQAFTQLKNELFNTVGKADNSPLIKALDDIRDIVKDPSFQRGLVDTASNILKILGAIGTGANKIVEFAQALGYVQARADEAVRRTEKDMKSGSYSQANYADLWLGHWNQLADEEFNYGGAGRGKKPGMTTGGTAAFQGNGLVKPSGSGASGSSSKISEADRMIARLREENALYGDLTRSEEMRIALQEGFYGKVTPAQDTRLQQLADELTVKDQIAKQEEEMTAVSEERTRKEIEAWQASRSALEDVRDFLMTEQEKLESYYQRRVDMVEDAARRQIITEEEKTNLILKLHRKLNDDLEELQDEMSEFTKRAAQNMQDALADFLFDPFEKGLKGMLEQFGNVIRRMVAEAAAAQIGDALFGKQTKGGGRDTSGLLLQIGGAIAGYFAGSGGSQFGAADLGATNDFGLGEVQYQGMGKSGGSMGSKGMIVHQHFTVQSSDGKVSRQTEMQIGAAAARGLKRADRRNG